MKFLIIDDDSYATKKIAEVIAGLGEISICTSEGPFGGTMPPKAKVLAEIGSADVILLDGQICSDYNGHDLLPLCAGKKVLGISTQFDLGEHNWFGKDRLTNGGAAMKKSAAEALRARLEQLIA